MLEDNSIYFCMNALNYVSVGRQQGRPHVSTVNDFLRPLHKVTTCGPGIVNALHLASGILGKTASNALGARHIHKDGTT